MHHFHHIKAAVISQYEYLQSLFSQYEMSQNENIVAIIGISLLILISLPFILHKVLIRHQYGTPPLHKGWIPYYGVSFQMDRNPEQLLAKLHKKYGDIFTIWTAGRRMTICLDILSAIPSMYRNTKQMDFHQFTESLKEPVMGYPREYAANAPLQRDIDDHVIAYVTYSENVKSMTQDFISAFDKVFVAELKKREGEFKVDMSDWARYLMFAASCKAVFGPHFPSDDPEVFRDFLIWEWDFVNMAKYKPQHMVQKGWDARERMFKVIEKELREHEDLASEFVKERIAVLSFLGEIDGRFIGRVGLRLLHGLL
jgi:hypothetical protein